MKKQDYYNIAKQKMQYLNYAEQTIKMYLHYINRFMEEVGVPPSRLTAEHFTSYLEQFKFTSRSQQNQVVSALKLFYDRVLERKYGKVNFERPRKETKLPEILDKDFLIQKISEIQNLKHKAILMLAYSVGLRVSEIIAMKIEHINSERMLIHIHRAKGHKDRIVPLSENVLSVLREYFLKFKPKEYLFNGQTTLQYSPASCQAICKKYISAETSIHKLRHSCFTHLLEAGTDLRIIQKIAGHASSKTTEVYTHVSNRTLNKVALPI